MQPQNHIFKKNLSLIVIFMVLISVALVAALIVAYNLTEKYVENEFSSRKIDVLDQTLKPYNDFFQNKIPEVTSYQGFLDSASAGNYAGSVFGSYSFVKRIRFYDIIISSRQQPANKSSLNIAIKAVFQYLPAHGGINGMQVKGRTADRDFELVADKFSNFIETADTSRVPDQDEQYKIFYDVKPARINYLNIPRREEIKAYKQLQQSYRPGAFYKQNMMAFMLDAKALKVKNNHTELYKEISIQPVVYDPLNDEEGTIITEVAFPGAFSDYKLYFRSPKSYLSSEINRRFAPTGAIVILIYVFLVLIGWLINRNLNTNLKLFKLQYDFINNFTHEFKTPVSVIKIAGSNLKGDGELTERQRKHYGRILDEEADKLNDLMNKLLSFTQIENRSITLKKQEINVEEFVKRYIETFRIKYPDFKLTYQAEHPLEFFTDPVLLGSLFQNLIENAYKYSNPENKELNISIMLDKRNIVFSFADKGIGIPRAELANVFKKFYRIQNKYNQNGSVGLGLAFCKELANFMNGDITVKSKVNEGSEFTVTLPYEN
jgi:two-component system phosphate regulon sensor histidine kinase PhoR